MGLQAGTAAEYDKTEAEKYKAWPSCVRMDKNGTFDDI